MSEQESSRSSLKLPKPKKAGEKDRVVSDFPKFPLREAIAVAEAIENENGGKPLPPTDLAIAIGKSPGSSGFRALLSASIKYGLTGGSFNSDRVEVRDLGSRLAMPVGEEDRSTALVEAALSPPTFRSIFDHFRGKKLPELQFFAATVVREFGVPRDHAEQCVSIFIENARMAGLIRNANSGQWLAGDASMFRTKVNHEDISSDPGTANGSEQQTSGGLGSAVITGGPTSNHGIKEGSDAQNRRVFVTHGKNKNLVPQLRELLSFGQFEPVVSVDRESVAKPIPDKVMDDMRSCGAAIIHVDAEREMMTQSGEKEIVLNGNVLIEIGASLALYGRRFILLVERGVRLPSNLSGLYEVRYEGERLDGEATLKLLKAFNEFKNYPRPNEHSNSKE